MPVLIARRSITSGRGRRRPSSPRAFARQIALIEAGRAAAGARDRQPRPAARHHRRARHGARVPRDDASRPRRAVPYNICTGRAVLDSRRWSNCSWRGRASAIAIVQDPSRLRPNDMPVVVGDHARLTRDTGWTPAVPLEQPFDDLLAHWRRRSPLAVVAGRHTSQTGASDGIQRRIRRHSSTTAIASGGPAAQARPLALGARKVRPLANVFGAVTEHAERRRDLLAPARFQGWLTAPSLRLSRRAHLTDSQPPYNEFSVAALQAPSADAAPALDRPDPLPDLTGETKAKYCHRWWESSVNEAAEKAK